MKVIMIAGTFTDKKNEDGKYGKPSSLAAKLYEKVTELLFEGRAGVHSQVNGGSYDELRAISEDKSVRWNQDPLSTYDYIFWFPDVPNELDKVRDIKKINPTCMLITSKRNDNEKYEFGELVQRALAQKANLVCEFSKKEERLFNIRVLDPLGCVYADTTDIDQAANALADRLIYIKGVTRQPTITAPEDKIHIMNACFNEEMSEEISNGTAVIPDEQRFVDIVRRYAVEFQKLMPTGCKTERFIGNASLRPPQVGRCGKGMPSFRRDNIIFVSKRNIDKQFIELENFVPVYLEGGKLYYCGQDKPSVDTPIQVRLYEALPNIKYMLHSHCYLEDAPYTSTAIPCGAIEEYDEILRVIYAKYGGSQTESFYKINLIGHGSIVMADSPDRFEDELLKYKARKLPEFIPKEKTH